MQTAVLYLGAARRRTSPVAGIQPPRHATQPQYPVARKCRLALFAAEFASGQPECRPPRETPRSPESLAPLQPISQAAGISRATSGPGDSLPASCLIGQRE